MEEKPRRLAHNTARCRPNLSAKLERLKVCLRYDTIRLPLRDLKLKTRGGVYDPLRRRSKPFRKAISTYAPPYYFWHKEQISRLNLKKIIKADEAGEEMDVDGNEVSCIWCRRSVDKNEYEYHRLKKCKKRFEFAQNGYYQCASCKESFLDETHARHHVSKHFPNQKFVDSAGTVIQPQNIAPKSFDIICRDQAKRKKWL